MGIRTTAAQALSTVSTAALKNIFRRPAGNFPGKIALYADPRIIASMAPKLAEGSISVVGTNGKTTITNLIADCLEACGKRVVCNRTGANLDSGIATSLLNAGSSDWGVFETDELWLAKTLPQLQSRYVLLLNLFRDQLDRVGEVDRIQESIASALKSSPETVLVYNADDPFCEAIARRVENRKLPFGIGEDLGLSQNSVSDARMCQHCEGMLDYRYRSYNQLGDYACPNCDFARPDLRFAARNCRIGEADLAFDIVAAADEGGVAGGALAHIEADYAGTYMVYNLLAAYIGAHLAGANNAAIKQALASYRPQNGRLQRLIVQGKQVLLNLAKNPTGFNQNLDLIAKDSGPKVAAFFVNDNEGDGRDVSWLWDIDFEELAVQQDAADLIVFAGGMRRNDLQLRLKYAGISAELVESAPDCMAHIAGLSDDYHVYMIANYTSLPDVRESMEQLAAGKGPISAPPLRTSRTSAKNTDSNPAVESSARDVPADHPLRIMHLLPDLLNLYGDGGNVNVLARRCAWRGIPVQIDQVNFGDTIDLAHADIVVLGGGPDREQKRACAYLQTAHNQLQAFVETDGVLLAVCGGYQILGSTWVAGGEEVEGLRLLDVETHRPDNGGNAVVSGNMDTRFADRLVGDIALLSPLATRPIIGYENHAGRTTLASAVEPFGTVIDKIGCGNSDTSGADGARLRNVVATYLHGPVLAKNPQVADWLIARAIERRTGSSCKLSMLDDTVENTANQFMCERLGVR